ncbi:MAG: TonB-dependent receptor [Prevotella sp.]
MKEYILTLLALIVAAAVQAQEKKVTGQVIDSETSEPMIQTTVQLLKMDSSYVAGTVSNADGLFSLKAPDNGKYLLKLSSVGYATQFKRVEISGSRNLAMGKVKMQTSAVMLKETTVTGMAKKVVLKEDTFVYNSAAYRTPEGSVVEELVKRIPGAEISDDGTITVNGKTVKKVKIDGKEFMTGDTKTAIKNLPTSIVEKIKVYDEKSDLSRVTGIDDGNEETVLDFGVKKGMNKGVFSNADLAAGTESRYAERLMGAYFNSKFRTMVFANANNTNDMGFPGGGGRGSFGRGRNGLNATKMLGANFNYDDGKTLKLDGSVRWNHANGDARSKSSTENFVSTVGAFSNSLNQNYTRSNSWNAQMRLEWKPDTMTNIMFRPTFSQSSSDGRNTSTSASYSEDPYLHVADPLEAEAIRQLAEKGLMVNRRVGSGISYSENKRYGGMLQLNRKLGTKGRNITLRADGSYSEGDSRSLSLTNVHLYQLQDIYGNDSTYQTNRFNLTPTRNWSYSLQTTYSEPLWKSTFLQFSYKYTYSYSKSDRATYDFSNLGEDFFAGLAPVYRSWDSYLARLEHPYTEYVDESLSRFSEYKNYTHEVEVMFRMIREKYNFNVGIMTQPQKSHFIQDYQGVHADTTRNVVNVTPTLDFRYRFNKVSNLRINYRGSTAQPSMSDLLDITDDSDPLNITKGNPGLKPSFTNSFRFFYNTYIEKRQQAIMTYLNFNTTRNSISQMLTYDDVTGGTIRRPENINGNWNIDGMLMYNTAIDTAGVWNVNTSTNVRYTNSVGYVTLDQQRQAMKSATKTLTLGERLETSYRNQWLEVALDGSFNYDHSRNKLQAEGNLDTWRFAYGGTVNLTLPWGTRVATDMHENSRRGYNDASMNTNELIWNAQLSQSFLKGSPLTVTIQFYDILGQQSNFSRTINAMQRNDTEFNAINSYAMVHVIYRLNIFGGKNARQGMRGPEDGPGGPGGSRGGNRGMGRGGFGGPPPHMM